MKALLFILILGTQSLLPGADLQEMCIAVAVAESGAQPTTLALRTVLTSTTSTAEDRRLASMRLNAIYNAAVASGRMEYLRITAERNAENRAAQQAAMQQQMFLIQSWQLSHPGSNTFYPYYLPR